MPSTPYIFENNTPTTTGVTPHPLLEWTRPKKLEWRYWNWPRLLDSTPLPWREVGPLLALVRLSLKSTQDGSVETRWSVMDGVGLVDLDVLGHRSRLSWRV